MVDNVTDAKNVHKINSNVDFRLLKSSNGDPTKILN